MTKKIILLLLVIMVISACSVFDNTSIEEQHYSNPAHDNLQSVKNSDEVPNVKQVSSEKKIAKDLGQLAHQVKGVKGSTAIVSGIYSAVGITFDDNLTTKEKETITENVYEVLSNHPRGVNSVVATNPEHVNQLKQLGERLYSSGKLADNVYEELGTLIAKIGVNDRNPTRKSLPNEHEIKESKIKQKID